MDNLSHLPAQAGREVGLTPPESDHSSQVGDPEPSPGISENTLLGNNNGITSATDSPKNELADQEKHLDPMTSRIEGGVEYKSMVWWQAGMVMVAETISLGILSLPRAMADLGIVLGLILLMVLGAMASYTGFVIGQFKMRHPHIHSFACAGEILFGKYGRWLLGWGQFAFYVFIMGSHILTFSIMMNAITDHAACTIVWMVIGTIMSLVFTLPRTLKNLSYYSVASFVSIIGAVMITMIGVSITQPGKIDGVLVVRYWPREGLGFHDGFNAVSNMVFAYAGHVAFFTFISELKDPREFPKALTFLQCSDISMYIITAVVVYYYAGEKVASPALDSASPVVKKVAYGVALPTIVIAGVVNAHVGVKFLYVKLLHNREDDIMHQKGWKSYRIWLAMVTASWFGAWLIAESVPVFGDLLSLTSALFASWFTFGLSGMFWIHMNGSREWRQWTMRKRLLFVVNVLNVTVAAILFGVGTWASIQSMINNRTTKKPFSCANNAGRN